MARVPKSWAEAASLGGKLLWIISRLHLIGVVVGAVGVLAAQFLTGFWEFRTNHQSLVRAYYEDTLEAHQAFQRQIERFNAVFEGSPLQKAEAPIVSREDDPAIVQEIAQAQSYEDAAQAYIGEIQAISRLLPRTESEVEEYIDTISKLQKYYEVKNPPKIGSVDWINFYGEFRLDLDNYIAAREDYLGKLADEVGSYSRFLRNS